jgi:hypothetical protein
VIKRIAINTKPDQIKTKVRIIYGTLLATSGSKKQISESSASQIVGSSFYGFTKSVEINPNPKDANP